MNVMVAKRRLVRALYHERKNEDKIVFKHQDCLGMVVKIGTIDD
jgi:hypothetical protein